jgi:hypothetical protein
MTHDPIRQLIADEASGRYSRRHILQRAAALGLSAPAVAALFAGAIPLSTLAQDADNPLGVDPSAPLDVVIFKGGFGDDYALHVNKMYQQRFPDAQITYAGIQRLGEQLQPRFVAGTPPDVIDNSGAGNLDNAALVAEGQLSDLADLLAAPSLDTEGKTVGETLDAAFSKTVDLANKMADKDKDADLWDIADGLLAGAIQYWLYSRQPCGDTRCQDCMPISTAEGRMSELKRLIEQLASESEYFHTPTDSNAGRA